MVLVLKDAIGLNFVLLFQTNTSSTSRTWNLYMHRCCVRVKLMYIDIANITICASMSSIQGFGQRKLGEDIHAALTTNSVWKSVPLKSVCRSLDSDCAYCCTEINFDVTRFFVPVFVTEYGWGDQSYQTLSREITCFLQNRLAPRTLMHE